jgi:hypothetical protein
MHSSLKCRCFSLTILLIASLLAGCGTLSMGGDTLAPGDTLAGRKTFTVSAPIGGGQGLVTGPGGGAGETVMKTIQSVLTERGYTYQASGSADISISSSWVYNLGSNPNYSSVQIYQNTGTPVTSENVGLSIYARTGEGNRFLWHGDSAFPVPVATLTPLNVDVLVRRALEKFPAAAPAPEATPASTGAPASSAPASAATPTPPPVSVTTPTASQPVPTPSDVLP